MDYAEQVRLLADKIPAVAAELSGSSSLEDVMHWMKARGIPLRLMERVAQDEFSHDVLLPLEGGWLVFGST